MSRQNYADLEIRILQKDARGYPVEITFNGDQEFPRAHLAGELPTVDIDNPAISGEELFAWLFADPLLATAWAEARGRQGQRRIRLRIDDTAPELHPLPWESLRSPVTSYIAASDATPFSRYIAGPWMPGSPVHKRPIRILVAISNPTDLVDNGFTTVESQREIENLQKALEGIPEVESVLLPGPCTLSAIETALRDGFHILHFIGHGFVGMESNRTYLALADKENYYTATPDNEIAAMLSRHLANTGANEGDKLRLVFLSSCYSATRGAVDAFQGLAPKLVMAGVPAVIAMQDKVLVDTARHFSQSFYRELMNHGQVDRAANAARASLLTGQLAGAAIPALFLRLRDGQLFGNRGIILGARGESFWETLLENIADKECTPFIGPGVSAGWLPDNAELSSQLAEKFGYPFADAVNLPRVSQFIGTIDNRRLRKQVLSILTDRFRKVMGIRPAPGAQQPDLSAVIESTNWAETSRSMSETEPHHLLAELELPLYLTTNLDNFMTLALRARAGNAGRARREFINWRNTKTRRADLDPQPEADDPVVLHLFGIDTDLNSLVVTEDDHLDYLAQLSRDHEQFLPNSVNTRLATTTLLFLGYRLGDLDLKILMRGLLNNLALDRWDMLNVAVQLESSEHDPAREKEILDYFQKYFANSKIDIYWGDSRQFIAELSSRWKEYRLGR